MSFTFQDVREALEGLGLEEHDPAVTAGLLALDNSMELTFKDINASLREASVPSACIGDICGYLLTQDPTKRAALVAKAKARPTAAVAGVRYCVVVVFAPLSRIVAAHRPRVRLGVCHLSVPAGMVVSHVLHSPLLFRAGFV